MNRILLCIAFVFFKIQIFALNINDLKLKFTNVKYLEAEILQIKNAPYLFHPLKSDIVLVIKDETVHWKIIRPEKGEVILTKNELYIIEKNNSKKKINSKEKSDLNNFLSIINSIFLLDFNKIENNFELVFDTKTMIAIPKDINSKKIISSIQFIFNNKHEIKKVTLNSNNEKTELVFKNLEIQYK